LWTLGGALDDIGRKAFDTYFKKMLREPLKSEARADRIVKFEKIS
jgi:hypothetical protein